MFTGIVEERGEVVAATATEDGRRLRIAGNAVVEDLQHGQSVSVSGACLTVERTEPGEWFEVFLAAETVAKTYLGELDEGDAVNLERAVRADARLDGHFVQGHVDTVTRITDVRGVGEDWVFEFAVPEAYDGYVVEKGSVALDGISLTVAERDAETFAVAIVPTTYDLTTLGEKAVGDPVHFEADVIAKYVESLVGGYR